MKIRFFKANIDISKSIMILCFFLSLFILCIGKCNAAMTHVFGGAYSDFNTPPSSAQYCSQGGMLYPPSGEVVWAVPTCTLTVPQNNYAPYSGNFSIVIDVGNYGWTGGTAYIDSTIPISQQSLDFSAGSSAHSLSGGMGTMCYYLYAGGTYYRFNGWDYSGCSKGGVTPFPPDPPAPPTSCTINNSNALNVNLGTIDRALLVTVPGTGSARHIQIPVECSGALTLSLDMKLSYTPMSINGKQVVQSSANGLGVSIIYNEQVLSTTDTTPVQFNSGSNVIDLAFEAVRDPKTVVGDVPTGEFSASATVIMTQL
ncbi:MAG: fimbrial protein [Silvania sp.]